MQRRPNLRQTIVVPGERDEILEASGVRCYRLRGPSVPTQKPYRFMLATRSTSRIVAHERPDLIEVGSAWFAPWLVHLATRQVNVPAVWYYHSNFPRVIAPHRPGIGRRGAGAARLPGATCAGCHAWCARRSPRRARSFRRARGGRRRERDPAAARREPRAVSPRAPRARGRHPERATACPGARSRCTWAGSPGKRGRPAGEGVARGGAPNRRTSRPRGRRPCPPLAPARPRRPAAIWLPFEQDRDRLADLYAAVDICVSPGSLETFGLSAIEASPAARRCSPRRRRSRRERVVRSGAGTCSPLVTRSRWPRKPSGCCGADLPALGARGPRVRRGPSRLGQVFDRLFEIYRGVLARVTLLVSIHDVTPAFGLEVRRLWDICAATRRRAGAARRARLARTVAARASSRFRGVAARARRARVRRSCCTVSVMTSTVSHVGRRRAPRVGPHRARGRVPHARRARRPRAHRSRHRSAPGAGPAPGGVCPACLARERRRPPCRRGGRPRVQRGRRLHPPAPRPARVRSPVLRWSTRTRLRALGSLAVARGRWTLQRRASFPRLALHPQDLSHPAVARSLEPTLARWLARHDAGGYAEVLTALTA